MKPAAFVWDGDVNLEELQSLGAKIFASPKAVTFLEAQGIQSQSLGDPLGVVRIFGFGHKEIHLFGFDCSKEEGTRVCFESKVFYTDQSLASHAESLLRAILDLAGKGASISIHGDGMFPHMARTVIKQSQERVLNAIYDMQVCPPTYEVFSFLSQAEKYRVENGFTKIDMIFLPGPMHGFRDDGLPPSPEERSSMLHRICVGGARTLPSVRNIHVLTTRTNIEGAVFPQDWTNERPRFIYGPRFQKNGHKCLVSTKAAKAEIKRRFPKPYTTITLREADYWPNRNSNRRAWEKAARELRFQGVPAVVIPDTHGEGLLECDDFAAAAWDVDLRLALYEGAVLNLGVVNGPMVLCQFSVAPCPYIVFQKPDEESPGTQEAFMEAQGIKHGDQLTENGWTMWETDSQENVMSCLEKWFEERKVRMA